MKIGNYEFEIKNFKYLESRSEETYCFSAVLYTNGKKVANCGNSGQGGPTDIYFLPQYQEMEREIKSFLKIQPKIKYKDYEFSQTLEYIVNGLVEEHLKAENLKKLMKRTRQSLIFHTPKGTYYQIKWKKHTIDELLKIPSGRNMLKKTIADHVAEGNILINENIPSELLP